MTNRAAKQPVVFLSEALVLKIHEAEIARRGGPMMQFGGEFLHRDVFEMAAAYIYHIAGNHPFLDGNKRVALASAAVFLDLNGYRLREKGTALADMVTEAIEKHRSKSWIAARLRAKSEAI